MTVFCDEHVLQFDDFPIHFMCRNTYDTLLRSSTERLHALLILVVLFIGGLFLFFLQLVLFFSLLLATFWLRLFATALQNGGVVTARPQSRASELSKRDVR